MSDHQGAPTLQKRIGEFLILGVYLAIDAAEVWHRSHFWALFAAFVGVLALLLLDGGFSKKQMMTIGTLTAIACTTVYLVAPPILPDETETHGWLEPANDPFPKDSACGIDELQKLLPNGMLFSLGKPGMWFSKKTGGVRPLLTVGACTLMAAEFKGTQLLFNADIYDQSHQLVARIERNEFHLIPGKFAYQTRPDRSTLNVYDKEGKLLLSIHYGNKHSIQVGGTFVCSDGKTAKVETTGELTMTGPKGSLTWDKGCLVNTGGFVVSEWGFGIGPTPCWACDPQFASCALMCTHERARQPSSIDPSRQ